MIFIGRRFICIGFRGARCARGELLVPRLKHAGKAVGEYGDGGKGVRWGVLGERS